MMKKTKFMEKQLFIATLLVLSCFVVGGCGQKVSTDNAGIPEEISSDTEDSSALEQIAIPDVEEEVNTPDVVETEVPVVEDDANEDLALLTGEDAYEIVSEQESTDEFDHRTLFLVVKNTSNKNAILFIDFTCYLEDGTEYDTQEKNIAYIANGSNSLVKFSYPLSCTSYTLEVETEETLFGHDNDSISCEYTIEGNQITMDFKNVSDKALAGGFFSCVTLKDGKIVDNFSWRLRDWANGPEMEPGEVITLTTIGKANVNLKPFDAVEIITYGYSK